MLEVARFRGAPFLGSELTPHPPTRLAVCVPCFSCPDGEQFFHGLVFVPVALSLLPWSKRAGSTTDKSIKDVESRGRKVSGRGSFALFFVSVGLAETTAEKSTLSHEILSIHHHRYCGTWLVGERVGLGSLFSPADFPPVRSFFCVRL